MTTLRLIILCLFIQTTPSYGQLNDFLFRHFRESKAVTYGLNNRKTRIMQSPTTLYGGYIGIKFGQQLKHVITLNSTAFWVGESANGGILHEAQLNYAGFSEEFLFWQKNKWGFSTYLHIGLGKARFRPLSFDPALHTIQSKWIVPTEYGLQGTYALNNWLEIRSGFGYRYVLNAGDWPLHGFYYKVGAGINFKELEIWYKDLRSMYQSIFPNGAKRTCRYENPIY